MKNLIQPENGAEAEALKSLLGEHGIRAEVVSFHDTAYDGLFQARYGWGVIRVDAKDYETALTIIREWQQAAPGELPWGNDVEPDEANGK